MPQGLLSLGMDRGAKRRRCPRRNQLGVIASIGAEHGSGWAKGREVCGRTVPTFPRPDRAGGTGADVPRPDQRTSAPKEADVRRDEVRYAGNEARPFLGRSASRQSPHDAPSWRAASRRSIRPRA